MRLSRLAPWTTVDDVLSEMEFKPLIAPELEPLDPPTEDELAMLRANIDPTGRTIGGEWITLEERGGTLHRVAAEPAATTA